MTNRAGVCPRISKRVSPEIQGWPFLISAMTVYRQKRSAGLGTK
jgi:hypothetical protein